jgi:PAS domain S-box-containing protein
MAEIAVEQRAEAGSCSGAAHPSADGALLEQGLVQILAQSMPDLIYVKDAECRYVYNNASHLRHLGAASPDEVRGKTVLDVYPAGLAETFYRDERAVIESGRALVDREELTTDNRGRQFWVSTTKVPLRDERGLTVGLAGISRDITDRKRAEEELRRAHAQLAAERVELIGAMRRLKASNDELVATQLRLAEAAKLQSVGAIAAGIAHEVKNPLAMLGIGLDYLAERMGGGDERVGTALTAMRGALEHAKCIVQGLLDFSRPGRLDRTLMSVRVPIERALLLMHGETLRRHVAVRTNFAPDLPPVSADCTKVEQVLINVIGNALHALGNGGTLTIAAACGPWGGDARGDLSPGDRAVTVTVDDSGPGIPPERLATLFEPFFTTKPVGEGTGLGLSIARNIMTLHGGAIDIGNRPEGGVRVTLGFKEGASDHGHETGDGR